MIKDIFTKKENQFMLGLIVISVILVMVGFYFLNQKGDLGLESKKIPNTVDEINWIEIQDKSFSLELEYPEHFDFFEDESEIGKIYNFYLRNKDNKLPFDHFVNQSHFSVYPEGVILQGPDRLEYFEQTELTNINGITFDIREYKTRAGETWAIMAIPKEFPKKWSSAGFVWVSSEVKDGETVCFDGDNEISLNLCNPLEGDQFYLNGNVDEDFINIGREFINKINFI